MRKLIVYLFAVVLLVGTLTRDSFLWKLFLEQPLVHNIEKGEFLSKLSIKYYGAPDYWKELALINRAPDPNLVYPEESILIPDFESIKRLHDAKSITKVNELVNEIERSMPAKTAKAAKPAAETVSSEKPKADHVLSDPVPSPERQIAFNPPEKESQESSWGWSLILLVFGAIVVVGLVAYYLVKRRRPDSEAVLRQDPDDSLELTLSDLEDERSYGRSKRTKRREEGALIE